MAFKNKLWALIGQYELKTAEYEVNTDQYLKSIIMSTQHALCFYTCTIATLQGNVGLYIPILNKSCIIIASI